MKLISDPSAESVDKSTIDKDDLIYYEEDLEGVSIDNWTRNKVIAMKVIN